MNIVFYASFRCLLSAEQQKTVCIPLRQVVRRVHRLKSLHTEKNIQ